VVIVSKKHSQNRKRIPMKKQWLVLLTLAVSASLVFAQAARAAEKLALTVVKVDSEETAGEDGKGANAVDGNADTIWHTQWQDASPACPHEIVIKFEPACKIKGLSYLPRQGEGENGTIKDYEIYVSEDGKDFGQAVKTGTFDRGHDKQNVVFPAKMAGYIKLVAKSEVNDQAWSSAAEIGVIQEGEKVAAKPSLKVVKVDSEETAGEDGKGANAVDGKAETFWHTQWQDASPACPHEIILQLDVPGKIKGLTYLPRQDETENGTIKGYEIYLSDDGKEFGQPVAKGEWANSKEKKTASFDAKSCSFIKLVAKSEVNDQAFTSAAEIGVVPAEE
jgi:endo-alpha-N-acetylgalactosaminidase